MTHPAYSNSQFIHDLVHSIRPYGWKFSVAVFLRTTSDIVKLYPAWALSQIVALLSRSPSAESIPELTTIFISWGASALYYGVTHNLSKYLGYQVAESAAIDLFRQSLAHTFTLDLTWQETENSGNKMKRIDKGGEGINRAIRIFLSVLIELAVNLVGITLVFFALERSLAYAVLFFIVTYYIIGIRMLKPAIKQEKIVNKQWEDLSGLTFESLNNIATIKALAITSGIMRRISDQAKNMFIEIKKRIFWFQLQGSVFKLYESLFEFLIVGYLAWQVLHGQAELSLIVLFIGLFHKVSVSMRELTDVTQELAVAKIWVSRAVDILKITPTIEHPQMQATQVHYPQNWSILRIQELTFNYAEGQALKNISLTVKRGTSVGIVGLSGAGKSTLFKLLLDLYENYDGSLSLDDLPLTSIHRQSYIDHVAVVLQDTELFNLSLEENIKIAGVPGLEYPAEKLAEVIKMAHLTDVVDALPHGVQTIIGEKGVKLSGGQRQRVGIARALYRQPDILLLDEATSHLDGHSEKQIQQALHECIHEFTTIVIAHRLSTIKEMDVIVVMEAGEIVEMGSFSELLEKDGAFAEMWRAQKLS